MSLIARKVLNKSAVPGVFFWTPGIKLYFESLKSKIITEVIVRPHWYPNDVLHDGVVDSSSSQQRPEAMENVGQDRAEDRRQRKTSVPLQVVTCRTGILRRNVKRVRKFSFSFHSCVYKCITCILF